MNFSRIFKISFNNYNAIAFSDRGFEVGYAKSIHKPLIKQYSEAQINEIRISIPSNILRIFIITYI